ncbi:MAG: hypothetical protein K0R71_2331 [Bacillales bacterium]|jgi:hypothetical protein|nr:hypothetical protein [Bacillales bacterium]
MGKEMVLEKQLGFESPKMKGDNHDRTTSNTSF